MHILYKELSYRFPLDLSFKQIQRIIEEYPYPSKIPDSAIWWYRKTDFGIYFLDKLNATVSSVEKAGIRGCDWKLFRPVFRAYFPSMTETRRASANLQFLLGNFQTPVDDYYFMKYILLSKYGNLSNEELDKMKHKDALMLYKYIIGELITRNVVLNIAKDNIIQQEEDKKDKQGRMIS